MTKQNLSEAPEQMNISFTPSILYRRSLCEANKDVRFNPNQNEIVSILNFLEKIRTRLLYNSQFDQP